MKAAGLHAFNHKVNFNDCIKHTYTHKQYLAELRDKAKRKYVQKINKTKETPTMITEGSDDKHDAEDHEEAGNTKKEHTKGKNATTIHNKDFLLLIY